jgi:hypothetical protein
MTRIPTKLKPWFEARRRFKLSHAHTQMARELGMNPRKLGSLAGGGQEPWKLPLPEFIVECYRKSFGRSEPEHVRSLEEVVQAEERRRKEKQARKAEEMVIPAGSAQSAVPADGFLFRRSVFEHRYRKCVGTRRRVQCTMQGPEKPK